LQELAAANEVGRDGPLQLSWTPFDPRFNRPQSGWYWQIEQGDDVIQRSESLWPESRNSGPASADGWLRPGHRGPNAGQTVRTS
jgi:hypothetical protein